MRRIIALSALSLLPLAAHARGNEDIMPQPMPVQKPGHVVEVKEASPAIFKEFKGPALHGLRVAPAGDTTAAAQGIHVVGLTGVEPAKLEAVLTPYLGKPITQQLLNDITRSIVLYYKLHVHTLVDVIAPAGQDITAGNVRFVVVSAKLGTLTSVGNKHFPDHAITDAFTTRPGETINTQTMLKDLDWANRNPFRRTNLLYRRGHNPGETDVVLQTGDRKPLRVYAGTDDTGTDLTGNQRIYAGFNAGDLCNCGQLLNYQFTGSADLEKMTSHALSYTAPLPWRHLLTLTGSYQDIKPDVAAPMKSDGFAYDLGADYTIPLAVTPNTSHDLSFGYDFKRSNNNLEFGGTQVFNTTVDISQFSGTYSIKQQDSSGDTAFSAKVVASPGGLTDKNTDAAHNIARAGSTADYLYSVLKVERTTALPAAFSLVTTAEAQFSTDRLPGSEQLTVGGYSTVRGYAEGETSGDSGFLLRNEVRAPALQPLGNDALTLLGFVDYGSVERNDIRAGETQRDTLLSVGPGLRYRLGKHVDVRADYGFQLHSELSDISQRAHVGVTISY